MFGPNWNNKRIIVTKAARYELTWLGLRLWDVVNALETGFDCPASRRERGTLEKCIRWKGKILRIVLKEDDFARQDGELEPVFLLVHAGLESLKKGRYHNEKRT